MRNFEERMAEIQKRSSARITRRRHQLTALCVPLVAALCVSGALMIPQQTAYDPVDTVPTEMTQLQYSGSITVFDGNGTFTCSDRDTVDAVRHLVSSLPPAEQESNAVIQRYDHSFTAQTTSLARSYAIVLETENETVHYKLVGKLLAKTDTDELFELTDAQRVTLLELLEIK